MNTLTHKGYGRIYVKSKEDIEKVKGIIKELDEFEYGYLPSDLIALFADYPITCYTHKFSDLDMDRLTATCLDRGIHIWVFDAGHNEYPLNLIESTKDLE